MCPPVMALVGQICTLCTNFMEVFGAHVVMYSRVCGVLERVVFWCGGDTGAARSFE